MGRQYLDKLIEKKLNGDKERVVELFDSDETLDELNRNAELYDWFHFEPKTYDGHYLVKSGKCYQVYFQERGRTMCLERHPSLQEAARSLFKGAGFIEDT